MGDTRALILAAGVGRRMNANDPQAWPKPKVLLEFDGLSLLGRHLAILARAGVEDVTLIAGFAATQIEAALRALQPACKVNMLINPDFAEGSVVSLWTGREMLRSGAPVLLMDADVIYDDRLMARLLASSHENCLLLDREIEPGDEPVKLCVSRGRIVDFHKRPTVPHEWHGESVGFFRLGADTAGELADRAGTYVASGRRHMEYEEPLRDMILASPPDRFGFEDISGLPWTEIDFPEDVTKATALLPELA